MLAQSNDMGGIWGGISFIWFVILYVVFALPLWAVFKKAGSDMAWAAFVPIVNVYETLKVVGRPGWWLIVYFIPIVQPRRRDHRVERPVEELRQGRRVHDRSDLPAVGLPRDPGMGQRLVPGPRGRVRRLGHGAPSAAARTRLLGAHPGPTPQPPGRGGSLESASTPGRILRPKRSASASNRENNRSSAGVGATAAAGASRPQHLPGGAGRRGKEVRTPLHRRAAAYPDGVSRSRKARSTSAS